MADIHEGITHFTSVGMAGQTVVIGSETVIVYLRDNDDNILMCEGTTPPTDGGAGYAKGCLFIQSDVTALATVWYLSLIHI